MRDPNPLPVPQTPIAAHQSGRFLVGEWRYLLMLNYVVDPAVLLPHVPPGTELDLFDGVAMMSVVGFRFLGTRVMRLPIPGHRNFDEVNLRFYVKRAAADGMIRHGVTFIREIVPRRMIALIARLAYNEPYVACRMRHTAPLSQTESPDRVSYEWLTSAGWNQVAGTAIGKPTLRPAGSEAHFITEHFWGYTPQRRGSTIEYQVLHPSWRIWDVGDASLSSTAARFYGRAFEAALSAPPRSAFLAEGSAVSVYRPRWIETL